MAMVEHILNPSTRQADEGGLCSSIARATQGDPIQKSKAIYTEC